MNETILLVIFAAVVLLLIWATRKVIASKKISPLSSRNEAALRIALCVVFALVAFVVYHNLNTIWDGVAILFSALVIYAVTHLLDRFVLK